MNSTLVLEAEAYTDLPAGMIANIVTYLEMRTPPAPKTGPRDDLSLERVTDPARYLAIYRELGERWFWFSRLGLPEAELAAILGHPDVEARVLRRGGRDRGLVELDFREDGEVELAFFGLAEDAIGEGAGRWMMDQAVQLAFARPVRRFFVHTCTFDHPRAVAFYRSSGFTPYKYAIEYLRDPRLTGLLSREAAPHVPLIV